MNALLLLESSEIRRARILREMIVLQPMRDFDAPLTLLRTTQHERANSNEPWYRKFQIVKRRNR